MAETTTIVTSYYKGQWRKEAKCSDEEEVIPPPVVITVGHF